ncbi:MAG: restriction endonuclease subunit S [Clostridium sp.]|nr:restriction endonuclease subunit S [Clostridium sp.]
MSKIEELIKKLCPNGVEYKTIGELFDVKNGYTPSKNNKYFWENGNIPWFRMDDIRTNGNILNDATQHITELAIKNRKFPKDSLIVATTATIGVHALIKCDFVCNQQLTCVAIKEKLKNDLNIKFCFYYFDIIDEQCKKIANQGGGMPIVSLEKMKKLVFPVPPLEVQCEIVHILDDFTLLSAELSAELKARQKQYDYYSEKLLNNIETKEISFGDACDVVTDYVAAGSFGDIAKNVQYINTPDYAQLIRTVDIKNNFQKADYIYVSKNAFNYLWRVNLDKECVILPNIGVNCGEVYYLSPEMLKYEKNVLGPNAILVRSNTNNIKYLSYLFKTRYFQKQLRKIISPAGQTKFNKTELKKLILHLPSKEIQENIVEKLDKLDEICNNIYNGLPAEIEARQKQYEYYRDKLLTFKELKVNE